VEVRLSGSKARRGDALLHLVLATLLISGVIAPGLLWPAYLRGLATLLFVGLALIIGRAYLAAFTTFRRTPDPPEKPADTEWPYVSVLVPAYNEASVLPRTMASMLKVDYPADRIEFVYVYEKRSTDRTGEIVRAYAAKDPRFVAVERNDRRGGKAAATNFGLQHCTGEILVSLDADHELKPDAVQRAVRHFLSDPKIMCVKGRAIGMNGAESFLALQTKLERDAIEKGDIYMRHLLGGFTFFGGGQAFFRREVFQIMGNFDEEILVEDIDFSVKLHQAGFRLIVDPKIQTFEENPALFSAWWAQRKRWSRGWMQVALRYLPRVHRMDNLTWRQKLDLYHTLAYVLVPVFFVVGLPLAILPHVQNPLTHAAYDTRDYFEPFSGVGWTLFAVAPFVVWIAMWAQDARDGIRHGLREWLGLPFLWAYLVFQTTTFWSAFLDQFILARPSVYVKTSKTGNEATRVVTTMAEATFIEAVVPVLKK